MANQDYVTRTPAKKKKPLYGKKPAKKTNAIPLKAKLMSLLLVILIAGFAYALWSLKTDPSTKTPLVEPEKVITKKQSNPKETTALPKPPKEKWTYVKDLASKEIEVGQYEVKENGPYKMQCGSFRTKKQAQVLKANIAFSGIAAQIKTVQGTSGIWHKVVLGPYARKRLAEKDKHKLKRNNINYCIILLWR